MAMRRVACHYAAKCETPLGPAVRIQSDPARTSRERPKSCHHVRIARLQLNLDID